MCTLPPGARFSRREERRLSAMLIAAEAVWLAGIGVLVAAWLAA